MYFAPRSIKACKVDRNENLVHTSSTTSNGIHALQNLRDDAPRKIQYERQYLNEETDKKLEKTQEKREERLQEV